MEWVKHGFGESLCQTPVPDLPYIFDFNEAILTDNPFIEIANGAIQRIVNSYPPPYTLMVSGGIDSQAMMLAWKNSGFPFTAVSVRFNYDLNSHDLATLPIFSNRFGIKIESMDFDVIEFLENNLEKYALPTYCTSPQFCVHMANAERIESGTTIYSGNLLTSNRCYLNYSMMGLYRFKQLSNRSIIPFFFQSDKELSVSALPLLKNNRYFEDYESRVILYNDMGLPVIPQPEKLTGFELVKDYYDKQSYRITVKDKLEFRNENSNRVFDRLFRYRLKRKIKYLESVVFRLRLG